MTTPCSGRIAFSDINIELTRPSSQRLSMDDGDWRVMVEKTTPRSERKMSDSWCKNYVIPGSVEYYSDADFTVQPYINLTVELWAGGGGGGGGHASDGFVYGYNGGCGGGGGTSAFNGVNAYGGGGGCTNAGGGAGSGDGGSVSVGGGAPGGPGAYDGGPGGAGGYCVRRWNKNDAGAPPWRSTIHAYVGGGGGGGPGATDGNRFGGNGGAGTAGHVKISWGL